MKILVIGASARAAAQSVRRAGIEVAALDLFVDRDLAEIADCEAIRDFPESVLDQAKRWPDHAILLCGGMENYPEIVSELAASRTIVGPNASQMRQLRSLANWKKWAAELGDGGWIRFPATIELDSSKTGTPEPSDKNKCEILGRDEATKWLFKSDRSAGGMKVALYDRDNRDQSSAGYIQKYVAGPVLGITLGCSGQETKVLGVMQNVTVSETGHSEFAFLHGNPYLYAGSIGPITLDAETELRLANWVGKIASSIQYQGLLQADFVLGDDGVLYLLEFNPRWTASMELIEMSCQTNLIDLQLRLQFADPSATPFVDWPRPLVDLQVQKRILYASRNMTISSETSDAMMTRTNYWANQPFPGASLAGWADVPHAGTRIDAGSPLATVWAIRPSTSEPMDALKTSRAISPKDRWPEIDEVLETLDGYPACIHTVFTRH